MATLPADRTKLALAQGNQVPSAVASSTKNINAITELYDTVDLLNNKVNTMVSEDVLSALGIINVKDYGASGSANTYTGSITAGSRSLVLTTSSHDFVAGQGISIPGAGAAGATLVTTVSSVSGATVTVATAASTTANAVTIRHDDTESFNQALRAASTTEYTESVPTQGPTASIYVPPGKFNVSSTINFQSYIRFSGAGKDTSIIVSYITNGDPILLVTNESSDQQFYNVIEGLTIDGRSQNCIGIKIYKTSRWILRDIMVDNTNHEGLWMENAYLGEIYSPMIRSCGDSTHSAVLFTGATAADGPHTVSIFGGEVNGGSGTGVGVKIVYGISIKLFSVTIEGFTNNCGLENQNGNVLVVHGGYFESNKDHIVETSNTIATNYIGNYFGPLAAGSRGHIGITAAQACRIEGNDFVTSGSVKIFDATGTSSGTIHMSSIRCNYAPTWPISIDSSLITSARATGTVIETYDGASGAAIYGAHIFKDSMAFEGNFQPNLGITRLNNLNVVVKAGTGSPEGVVTATKGIYFDVAGTPGATVFIKTAGTNNAANWKPLQEIRYATTANRVTLTSNDVGYMMFDTTLGKPIWWNGANWKDATGTTV